MDHKESENMMLRRTMLGMIAVMGLMVVGGQTASAEHYGHGEFGRWGHERREHEREEFREHGGFGGAGYGNRFGYQPPIYGGYRPNLPPAVPPNYGYGYAPYGVGFGYSSPGFGFYVGR